MTTYSEKLKDPRWQKKRLEILQRDDWQCQRCGDRTTTLNVHHLAYFSGQEPWECPSELMQTVCSTCHDEYHQEMPIASEHLIRSLKGIGAWSGDVESIAFELQHFAPILSQEGWRVFHYHFDNLIRDMASGFNRLKAERDKHLQEHGIKTEHAA